MVKSSMAQLLQDARLMADGVKKRQDALAKSDLNEAAAENLARIADEVAALDSEQEELKALLKAKSAALLEKEEALAKALAEARKAVKFFIDKNDWKTFGITDKR